MNKYKFLEFDVETARQYSQKLFGRARDTIGESYVLQATNDQHYRNVKIMKKLISIIESQNDALKKISIQTTSKEYAENENDDLDGQTAIEAWDALIKENRIILASIEATLKELK